MATVFHQIQYWTYTLPPGQSAWFTYGPDDRYKNGTVQVTCCPDTQVYGTNPPNYETQSLTVPQVYNVQSPQLDGDLVFNSCSIGFYVVNNGSYTVGQFSIAISVIGP